MNEQPGSASVVQSVSSSLNGIGYSGIGYKTSGVRAVPLSKTAESERVEATPDNVYVNKAPGKPLSPLEGEFIKMVLATQGQKVVVKDGYIPLPSKVAAKALAALGL